MLEKLLDGKNWFPVVTRLTHQGRRILLLMGVLHGVNLLLLPIIGRLLMLNKQLDQEMRDRERGAQRPQGPDIAGRPGQP